jgi:N-acetylneuraminic acid mutarotase
MLRKLLPKKIDMKKIILLLLTTINLYAQSWQTVETTNSCTNRHENSLTAIKNSLYLLGGRGIKPVESLDLKNNTWSKMAITPLEFNHFQAVSYQNEVWVLGAFEGKYPHETPIPHIYIFNPEKNQWRKGAEIPADRRRGSAGAFVYQNKIYMVCGIQDGHWDGHVAWLDEFDPQTQTWRKLPDAPHTRDHLSAAVIKNKLYIAGGRRSTARINQVLNLTEPAVDVFDFKTETWTTLPASSNLPTERAGVSAVPFGHKLLIMGGESGSQTTSHSEVEALNIKTLQWKKAPNLLKGRHGTGAVVVKKKIYTVAGSGNRGGGPELNSVEVLEF